MPVRIGGCCGCGGPCNCQCFTQFAACDVWDLNLTNMEYLDGAVWTPVADAGPFKMVRTVEGNCNIAFGCNEIIGAPNYPTVPDACGGSPYTETRIPLFHFPSDPQPQYLRQINVYCAGHSTTPGEWAAPIQGGSDYIFVSVACNPFVLVFDVGFVAFNSGVAVRCRATITCAGGGGGGGGGLMAKAVAEHPCVDFGDEMSQQRSADLGLGTTRRWFGCTTGEHLGHCTNCNLHPTKPLYPPRT